MSYQVLARKWRPRTFADVAGQEHVVRALGNALDNDRLHHAYLFTGTRGVGKTTLARIFAKSLNCEQGVGSTPCGRCASCEEVDAGRFVDLLEVDAASRTKVDQTRELLDNVPYAPVKGRYKVYLIDEVHMFSASSFNALLKTLEEPPPHVKFLLATTDPQKVPVTVLSRCLQFNLKRLPVELIARQLARILEAEAIAAEGSPLPLLAEAADGSMRDALSLLDQAIAFGAGRVREEEVRLMLGGIGRERIAGLIDAAAGGDGAGLLAQIDAMAEVAPDFAAALCELLRLLHRVALIQAVPELGAREGGDAAARRLADSLAPEDVQLFYQIALVGQRDLPLAPDPRSGFEMVLLRMLAFRPEFEGEVPAASGGGRRRAPAAETQRAATAMPETPAGAAARPVGQTGPAETANAEASKAVAQEPAGPPPGRLDWHALVARLGLGGIALQLANNCLCDGWDGRMLRLSLNPDGQLLRVATAEAQLLDALRRELGPEVALRLDTTAASPSTDETPAQRLAREQAARQHAAERAIEEDPIVRGMAERFSASVVPGSVRPRDRDAISEHDEQTRSER